MSMKLVLPSGTNLGYPKHIYLGEPKYMTEGSSVPVLDHTGWN
jgi:hypothetical protein